MTHLLPLWVPQTPTWFYIAILKLLSWALIDCICSHANSLPALNPSQTGPGCWSSLFAFLGATFSGMLSLCSSQRSLACSWRTWVRGLLIKGCQSPAVLSLSPFEVQTELWCLLSNPSILSASYVLSALLPRTSLCGSPSVRTFLMREKNFFSNTQPQHVWILHHLLTLDLSLWCFYLPSPTLLANSVEERWWYGYIPVIPILGILRQEDC